MVDIGYLTLGLNLGTIVGVLALLLLFLGAKTPKTKKDTKKQYYRFGGFLVFVFFLPFLVVSLQDVFSTPLGGGEPMAITGNGGPGAQLPGVTSACEKEDTTVRLSGQDFYTSQPSGGTHRYRVNGNPALTVSDAGTFEANPGDRLEILWGNGTSATYYGDVTSEIVPCSGAHTFTTQTYRNNTVTIRTFNEEGNLITGTENETIGTGDTVNLDLDLQGTHQYGFPYGLLVIVEYETTNFTDVDVQLPGVTKVSGIPTAHTLNSTAFSAEAFKIPALLSNDRISGTLYLESLSTADPTGMPYPIKIHVYPYDYFVNEDTGGSFDGPAVEDEDNAFTFDNEAISYVFID